MQGSTWQNIALGTTLALYLGCGLLLIRSSIDIEPTTTLVRDFYARFGFDMERSVARMMLLSLLLSCLFHALLMLAQAIVEHRPRNWEGRAHIVIYCFFRAVFCILFCLLVAGALGDNISSKLSWHKSAEFSVLLGCLVLGSVTWIIRDFIYAIHDATSKARKTRY